MLPSLRTWKIISGIVFGLHHSINRREYSFRARIFYILIYNVNPEAVNNEESIFEMCPGFQHINSMINDTDKKDSEPRNFCIERKLLINRRGESALGCFFIDDI